MILLALKGRVFLPLAVCFFSMLSCTTEQKFGDIGDNVSGPIDVIAYNNLFYVLNSDFARTYNEGSMLVVDPATSTKVRSVELRRMGRTMFATGDSLMITYGRITDEEMGYVEIRRLSEDLNQTLSLVSGTEIDCSPINGILSTSLNYAVVSCSEGTIYVADLNGKNLGTSDAVELEFIKVRSYASARRALYIMEDDDEAILFAFPTDLGSQTDTDFTSTDSYTFGYFNNYDDETGELLSDDEWTNRQEITFADDGSFVINETFPNEIPDLLENDESDQDLVTQGLPYTVAIYNLKRERALDFPYKEIGSLLQATDGNGEVEADNVKEITVGDTTQKIYEFSNNDLKYIKYSFDNVTSEPIPSDVISDGEVQLTTSFVYRTNFWEVKTTSDPRVFYLSQRGLSSLSDSNNILKVTIGNKEEGVNIFDGPYTSDSEDASKLGRLPVIENILSFERVSGSTYFEKQSYPGDFELVDINNESFLFVNQFRDEAYFGYLYQLYAIDAKSLSNPSSAQITPYRWLGGGYGESVYQLAVTSDKSYLASCSFYGDTLMIFPVDSITGIDEDASPVVIK